MNRKTPSKYTLECKIIKRNRLRIVNFTPSKGNSKPFLKWLHRYVPSLFNRFVGRIIERGLSHSLCQHLQDRLNNGKNNFNTYYSIFLDSKG